MDAMYGTPAETRLVEIVFPENVNHVGTLFGGHALKLMDMAAAICGSRFCRRTVVTAATERIDFRKPVLQGRLAEVVARVVGTRRTSFLVEVELWSEDLLSGHRDLSTVGHFVMVALDADRKPAPVPQLSGGSVVASPWNPQAKASEPTPNATSGSGAFSAPNPPPVPGTCVASTSASSPPSSAGTSPISSHPSMTSHPQLLRADRAVLLIVDIQDKLHAAMPAERRASIEKRVPLLIEAARTFDIPVLVTEQYPRGLGPTIPVLAGPLDGIARHDKLDFSATAVPAVADFLTAHPGRDQWLIVGMEAHVCVYQTMLALRAAQRGVWIVADAVASRAEADLQLGLGLARDAGAHLTGTETVIFELLGKAGTSEFKKLQKLLLS